MQVYNTVCPRNCYSTCSFKVYVENGKIINIDPQPENRATPEGICIKGLSYIERANSKKRITYPLKKNKKGEFKIISWDEALDVISEKLKHFKTNYGAQSILFYAASGISGLLNGYSTVFWRLFGGATMVYGNLCWPAGLEATRLTLGENKHNAPWDLENAKIIVMWGKNPAETNVQQMIPVEKALNKGAKLIVIDPRRTQTSENADLLLQPKPGTDAALALAVANIIIQNNWHDIEFINKYVKGFEDFKQHVSNFSAKWAEEITDIPVDYIYQFAELIGKIKPLTIVPGYGMQRFTNGGQTTRCILALQIISGNIGKKGACWHYANLQSYIFDDVKEPLSYYPPDVPDGIIRRTIATAKLGEDMLDQKNPELKMVWVERGNPLTQNPDTKKIKEAFDKLEYKVVVEQFMTDTALEADIVLPAKNMFEQSDLVGSYWNPYVQLRQKVVEPAGEVKPETEIYYLLAQKLGFSNEEIEKHLPKPNDKSIENILKKQIARFKELDWDELKQKPLLAKSHEEIAFADFAFQTPSGKIELVSEQANQLWDVSKFPEFVQTKDEYLKTKYPLALMSPNTKYRIHSQFNNLNVIKHFNPVPFVELSVDEAKKRKIQHGNMVKVYNDNGEIKLKAHINYSMKDKCACIHNGWWTQEGGNVNFLTKGRETDMGHGTAFHDNRVEIKLL